MTRISLTWLKANIGVIAFCLIMVRIFWPILKVDSITLGLLIMGVLPWRTNIIESAKLSGGWEVKFRDLEISGREITDSVSRSTLGPTTVTPAEEQSPSYLAGMDDQRTYSLI